MKKKYVIRIIILIITVPAVLSLWLITESVVTDKTISPILRTPIVSTPPLSKKADSFIMRAAIPYWDQENAVSSMKKHTDLIDYFSLFWYYVDEEGDIQKYNSAVEDTSLITFEHDNDIQVSAVITNLPEEGSWDSDRVENIIADDEKMNKHIRDIRSLLKRLNFDGVTIDYESVDANQRQNFSKFVDKLSLALDKDEKYVEVALHPKKGIFPTQYAFQDWETLGKGSVDRIYIMAYEEHYDEGEPGPVASFPWVTQIVNYAKNQDFDHSKLLLGIPLDGYDWDTDSDDAANGLTFEEVEQLLDDQDESVSWDDKLRSPYFEYDTHEVWFENARSFEEKIKLAKENGLGGITLWRLGGEDEKIWDVIRKYK